MDVREKELRDARSLIEKLLSILANWGDPLAKSSQVSIDVDSEQNEGNRAHNCSELLLSAQRLIDRTNVKATDL